MKCVLEVLQSGAAFLERKGVEQPRLNMEHLLAHVLGLKRLQLYLQFDRPLEEPELESLRPLVERRARGEPLQHLLGTVEFCGRVFRCDARALVPRPETEELVELIIARCRPPADPPSSILDIGCGAGVIGLSLARAFPSARVTLADLSPDALALARDNLHLLELPPEQVTLVESDLFAALDRDARFDVIAANLPYVPREEIPTLSREVRRDPVMALDGGADGTDLIARFAAGLADRLAPGGLVAVEFGFGQAVRVTELFNGLREFGPLEIVRDASGRERFGVTRAAG